MINAIVLLTNEPNEAQISFFEAMASRDHDVFVVVDDRAARLPESKVKYVQIDDRECAALGFESLNPMITKRKSTKCSAWEKAIYYFSRVETSHDHVWFIEDDVLVTTSSAIQKIDLRYGPADIISAEHSSNRDGNRRGWWWWRCVPNVLPLPWGRSMICAIRISRALLNVVGTFVPSTKDALAGENAPVFGVSLFLKKLKTKLAVGEFKDFPRYLFIEYLFHTLALHNDKEILDAEELSGIVYGAQWNVNDMRPDRLYHPVKDRALHEPYRRHLSGASG